MQLEKFELASKCVWSVTAAGFQECLSCIVKSPLQCNLRILKQKLHANHSYGVSSEEIVRKMFARVQLQDKQL